MNKLSHTLANIIKDHVVDATKGRTGGNLESRFIFNGPPLEFLENIFEELAHHGGIRLPVEKDATEISIPVLLVGAQETTVTGNPPIGLSGKCDVNHLLDVRDHPSRPSFIALIPPGIHFNASISTTSSKFGIEYPVNAQHVPFEQWWEDSFVQRLVVEGLRCAGITKDDEVASALQLVEHAGAAADEMDNGNEGNRAAVWRMLSRIYSIPDNPFGLKGGVALSLACGVPPRQDGSISHKEQVGALGAIADELSDGFKTAIDRIYAANEGHPAREELLGFLAHIREQCEIPTAFERATEAFYLPADTPEISAPPSWWSTLTMECWWDLLTDDSKTSGDANLAIECSNPVLPVIKGIPAIVRDEVRLAITLRSSPTDTATVSLSGGSIGKDHPVQLEVVQQATYSDQLPTKGQKTPVAYKIESIGFKSAIAKVISLATWVPGVIVTSRLARKLALPKKPRKVGGKVDWESSLVLSGAGRYELLLLMRPGTKLNKVSGIIDDATEALGNGSQDLRFHETRDGGYIVEVEVDGKYQVEITYRQQDKQEDEICRTYISCEEAKEEGCRSEFELLIKRNRQQLEKFGTKLVVQLDRHARSSSLQSWLLDEPHIEKSFMPIVIADDYHTVWAPPEWDCPNGPIFSQARFLHDPRPIAAAFVPPARFIDARKKIARRIRESTEDQSGLVESSPLGKWIFLDQSFRELVESYLDAYCTWLSSDRETASWVDAIAVCPRQADGLTLARIPDAIILSPLHPLRLAWHCLAQQVLFCELEGNDPRPCPAASILDPDCIPDLINMPLQSPSGSQGIDYVDFLAVECNSDYWSVLWNGNHLGQLAEKSRLAPFDHNFGLVVGGISSGFSPAQVGRALGDVADLLAAKPIVSVAVSSAGGSTDACNDGLTSWCSARYGNGLGQGVGPSMLEVYDTRPPASRPDQATIANLSEDTGNHVLWFERQPEGARPDLGIIAQLDSAQPETTDTGIRSPLSIGGLIRHRVRRQLHGAFLSESRQALLSPASGDVFADKVASCILLVEGGSERKTGIQFAPNVHAISDMLQEKHAGFVAVSSSSIDPACFLAGSIKGTYLWDYDLPAYSHRAGDTSGYYLLSQVREADRDALARVLEPLPGVEKLAPEQVEEILLEVARRGIPTVRGLSGDDTGATGDLGLFVAVRLLQDQFRMSGNIESILPVLSGTEDDASIAIIVPVDPFRGYLADLARSLGREKKDALLSRPDLLVVGIRANGMGVHIRLTPIEVKCRLGSIFGAGDSKDALGQAKALSTLFHAIWERAEQSVAWKLAFQHLLVSMVGFGLRVYSQQGVIARHSAQWANYHERIVATILGPDSSHISVDDRGRLVVIDSSPQSGPRDNDGDGMSETIVVSTADAGRIAAGDPQSFYDAVRSKIGDWEFFPKPVAGDIGSLPVVVAPIPLSEEAEGLGLLDIREQAPIPQQLDEVTTKIAQGESGEAAQNEVLPQSPDVQPECSGVVLSVGRTVDCFEPRQLLLNISDTRLNQLNIGVVGDLGTGKTQLLKSLIFQICSAQQQNRGIKPRLLIFDYKRDYSTPEFVAATGARVVRPARLPLNLFDTATIGESVAPWLDRFRFFSDVLDKIYSGIGPVQRDKLKGATRSAYETCEAMGRQPTIYDIHAEYRRLLGGKSDSPMSIIDDLVDMEVFEKSPDKTMSFDKFLDGIVVVSLDAMGQDDRSKNMLVAIMLNMFYENMLRTPKRPFIGSDPQLRVVDSYLLVDEADNIMRYEFDVLRKLLLQGREFGTGVILASQYLRHFKSGATDYREPLLTWFIHKVPNATPAELGALGFTSDLGELSERVKTLQNHHCLYKSFDVAGEVIRGLPFYELATGSPSTTAKN